MNVVSWLKRFLIDLGILPRPKISILIPFSTVDKSRRENLTWLLKYWKCTMPHVEVIIGESRSAVFCKGEAINNAFEKSNGKVIAVLDADAYISGQIIERCADRILEAQHHGHNLWFVPYRRLYRLTRHISKMIVHSDPCNPLIVPDPPDECDVDNWGDVVHYGHMYAAMAIVLPRKAMDVILCWDEHFSGWGGEDISFLRAMNTLFGKHKTTNNAIYHLYHPFHGETHRERTWDNQDRPNTYWRRASRYHKAYRKIQQMRELMEENYGYYQKRRNSR